MGAGVRSLDVHHLPSPLPLLVVLTVTDMHDPSSLCRDSAFRVPEP